VKLESINEILVMYQAKENAADQKIAALNSIHADKIRALMNSNQLLKKENKQLEKLTKEHKRSELIAQLQKDVADQDSIIETLRQICVQKNVSDDQIDNQIVSMLNKGPPRIRAPTREELKMEIKKFKGLLEQMKKKINENDTSNNNNGQKQQKEINNNNKQENSVIDQSVHSEVSESLDSNQNLVRKIEQLINENDELRLNLKAQGQIIEKYEDQLMLKSDEINELRNAKTDYVIINRKYETLYYEFEKLKEETKMKYIMNFDKEVRLDEMEIINKNQAENMKMQEDDLKMEIDSLSQQLEQKIREYQEEKTKSEDLQIKYNSTSEKLKQEEQKTKEFSSKNYYLAQENEKMQKQYSTQIASLTSQLKEVQDDYNQIFEERKILSQELKNLQQINEKLTEYQIKTQNLLGLRLDGQSWDFGKNSEFILEQRQLKQKIRELTLRELELQDQIEGLKLEKKLKEQRESAQTMLNKNKNVNMSMEQIKKEQINQARKEYESKITQLRLKIKNLEDKNQQFDELMNILASNIENKDQNSDISISVQSLQKLVQKENSSLSSQGNISSGISKFNSARNSFKAYESNSSIENILNKSKNYKNKKALLQAFKQYK
ncbi:hypothetical protein IMG5_173930, partial [Ichthyophthirius multifiliis]